VVLGVKLTNLLLGVSHVREDGCPGPRTKVQLSGRAHVPQQLTTHQNMSGGAQLNACEEGFARPTVNRKKNGWLTIGRQMLVGRAKGA
jgi:hypothetical protein